MLSLLCRVCWSEVSVFSVLQDCYNLKLNSFSCAKHEQQGPGEGRTASGFVAWPVSKGEDIFQGTFKKFCQPRRILMEGKKSSRLCWKQVISLCRMPCHNEVLLPSGLLPDRLHRTPEPTRSISSLSATRISISRYVQRGDLSRCDHLYFSW